MVESGQRTGTSALAVEGAAASSPVARVREPRAARAAFVGEDHGLHTVSKAELGEDVGHVGLDGRLAEEQGGGDLGVGEALGDELEYLEFALTAPAATTARCTSRAAG